MIPLGLDNNDTSFVSYKMHDAFTANLTIRTGHCILTRVYYLSEIVPVKENSLMHVIISNCLDFTLSFHITN